MGKIMQEKIATSFVYPKIISKYSLLSNVNPCLRNSIPSSYNHMHPT
jgi:hypothetical protein